MATVAEKIMMYREKAKDKSLPQDVRNTYLDRANELEMEEAKKSGVRMAKGGAVKSKEKKAKQPKGVAIMIGVVPSKKMAKGGVAKKGKC